MNVKLMDIILLILALIVKCDATSVIIIGAGPSGIAAATRLLEKNSNIDVTVLEAEDRIGGRVHSVPFGDAVVELGAQWCYEEQGNAVYDLVKSYDLLGETSYNLDVLSSDGRSFGMNLTAELFTIIESVYNNGNDTDPVIDTMTMGEYFNKIFNNTIHKAFENDHRELELSKMSTNMAKNFILSDLSAPSLDDLSARDNIESHGDYVDWMGRGYSQVFDIMMKKPPVNSSMPLLLDDKLNLNKEVIQITWSKKPVVTCKDGSSYTADYVIFTPSLGVLKSDHKTLFEPPLPNYKVEAIEKLGMGGTMKVILHYPVRWWASDLGGMTLVWTKEDEEKAIMDFPHGPSKDGVSWLSSICGFIQAENNSNVLYAWITGELVPEIEKISDETLLKGMHYIAQTFFGKSSNVSQPDKLLKSTWRTNPHFRGVYTYETLASRGLARSSHSMLAEPLTNNDNNTVLLFAGEATHTTRHSTVDGAISSGYREADRILKMEHIA